MATTQLTSTLIAACTVAAGASTQSSQRTFGSGVLCEAINIYVDINASGLAGTPSGGLNTLDVAIRPVALNGSGCYDGGPEFYQRRLLNSDAAVKYVYPFRFPGGAPKLFKVSVFNRSDKATATSALSAMIETVTVAV